MLQFLPSSPNTILRMNLASTPLAQGAGGPSSRVENRDSYGVVRGSYNYVDSEGRLQTQLYVADAIGLRVSGTNLPVDSDAPEAASLALLGPLPEPVQDTPEVAAAKAAHQAAYDEAAAAAAAAPDYSERKKHSVLATHALGAISFPILLWVLCPSDL